MDHNRKTVIVTGASQGIGAGIAQAFLARGYDVVATARSATKSKELSASDHLALVDGDIGQFETAQKVAELALEKFGSIDAVVANAGIFILKPFTEYTADDFRTLVSTNLAGFFYITQLAVKQMQAQKSGGSVVSITAALADNPIVGEPASVSMITKGGLNAVVRSLALEYAKEHIRFNAVAPGRRRHPAARRCFGRLAEKRFADGLGHDGGGHRQRGCLSDRSSSNHRRGVARGRWCAHWQMVENSNPTGAEQRLRELAIKLPVPPQPFGTYAEAVQTGNLLFLTGMLPTENRAAKYVGRIGAELDVEAGRKAARLAALNLLAVAREYLGSLNKVTRIVRLGVSVATSGDVRDQPKVADGASDLLRDVFGANKNPCRSVYGVASLPLGTPVLLDVIFEVSN